jgi:peptidoglycan/LPS O-acetylase OafA/YrhL
MNNSIKKTNRIEYFQYIRAISIIAVILIHSRNGISFQNTNGAWNFDYWLILRQIINFPVAVFFFLSGFFVKTKIAEKDDLFYYIKRGGKLYLPFLIWSAIYVIPKLIFDLENVYFLDLVIKTFLGLTAGHLYFILVLLQFTFLTPFLIKSIKLKKYNIYLFLITPLYLILLYLYTFNTGNHLPYYYMIFPAWFIFYYLGLLMNIKKRNILLTKIKNIYFAIFFVALGLLLSIFEGYMQLKLKFPVGFAASQIKFSSFIYSIAVINLIFIVKPYFENFKSKSLKLIGDRSYGIYYIHMAYIMIVSKLISVFSNNYLQNMLPFFQIIQLFLVTSIA